MNFKEFLTVNEGFEDEPYAFHAIIMAGGPGSGKSFVARTMFQGMGFLFADSDSILEKFASIRDVPLKAPEGSPEYKDYLSLMHNSMQKNITRANTWRENGYPYVIDTTAQNASLVGMIKADLESVGYDVGMVFVNAPVDMALRRNQERNRNVPDSYLIDTWKKSRENSNLFRSMFGRRFLEVENVHVEEKSRERAELVTHLHRQALKIVGRPREIHNPIGRRKLQEKILTNQQYHQSARVGVSNAINPNGGFAGKNPSSGLVPG